MAFQVRQETYPSSRRGSTAEYTAVLYNDGTTSCNCPGWVIRRAGKDRDCRHVRLIMVGVKIMTGPEMAQAEILGSELTPLRGRKFLVMQREAFEKVVRARVVKPAIAGNKYGPENLPSPRPRTRRLMPSNPSPSTRTLYSPTFDGFHEGRFSGPYLFPAVAGFTNLFARITQNIRPRSGVSSDPRISYFSPARAA